MLRLLGVVLGVATIYAFYKLATADGRQTVAPPDGGPATQGAA